MAADELANLEEVVNALLSDEIEQLDLDDPTRSALHPELRNIVVDIVVNTLRQLWASDMECGSQASAHTRTHGFRTP